MSDKETAKKLKELLQQVSGGETVAPKPPEPEVCDWFTEPKPDVDEGKVLFSSVFDWVPDSGDFHITTFDTESCDVPQASHYIFPREETEMLVRAFENGMKPRLVGDPGTGKTELVKQVCARTGRKFARLNFNVSLEPDDIFGRIMLVDGETKWVDGELITWLKEGFVILFDEINRAPASFHMSMQRLMEENGVLHIPGKLEGETTITPHANTQFISADNTKGLGDDMDRFDASVQDVSSLNRWEMTIEINYLAKHLEVDLVKQWDSTLHTDMVSKMCDVSSLLHSAYQKREIDLPFSPRTLKTWVKLTSQMSNPVKALKWAFVNALPTEQQNVVERIVSDTVGFPDEFGRLL